MIDEKIKDAFFEGDKGENLPTRNNLNEDIDKFIEKLKNEQEKAEILNKMLELAKINPTGLAKLIDGLPAKD